MTKHGIPLNTLKQCLEFLQWLHKGGGKHRLQEVSQTLYDRIKTHFDSKFVSVENVEKGLRPFLSAVSKFYERLCYKAEAGKYVTKSAEDISNALLDCHPKFFAAMYFLQYCVNNTFGTLGGGGWEKNYPGWEEDWRTWYGTYPKSGGDLQKYLRATVGDEKYSKIPGLLPGGFSEGEVIYYTLGSGYYQGYNMAGNLEKIVSKGNYNYFRSVFVSSAVADTGAAIPNTANALSLVRTFCDIVGEADQKDSGAELKPKLEEGLKRLTTPKSICWKDLQSHCAQLKTKLHTLFNEPKRFDFTGQATGLSDLNKEALAGKAADWLRENLTKVRGKLDKIDTNSDVINNPHKDNLGDYFTKNFFPYGFTFGRERHKIRQSDLKDLMRDWSSVINDLKKRTGSDLDRLREILSGEGEKSCKEPEPPPPVVEETSNQGKKSEGAQNQGKKAEGAQNQGKKAEEAQNQGKKTEGTPNQGEPLGPTTSMSTNQNNGQGEQKFPPPPGVTSTASDTSPGDPGAPGPAGSKGDPGPQGSIGTGPPASSSPTNTQVQRTLQPKTPPQPQQPPPPPPPATASGTVTPGLPAKPGVQGPGSAGSVTRSIRPGTPQVTVPPQTPSASGSSPRPTGGRGSDPHGGQDVTQTTSQGTGQTPSSGATASDATAAGGGGGAVDTDVLKRQQEKRDKDKANMKTIQDQFNINFDNIEQAIQRQRQHNMQKQQLANLRNQNIALSPGGRRVNWRHPYDPKIITRRTKNVVSPDTLVLDGMDMSNESSSDPALDWERRHRDAWDLPAQLVKETEQREREKFRQTLKDVQRKLEEDERKLQQRLRDYEKEERELQQMSVAMGFDGDEVIDIGGETVPEFNDSEEIEFDGHAVKHDSDIERELQVSADIDNAHQQLFEDQTKKQEKYDAFLRSLRQYAKSVNKYGVENIDIVGPPSRNVNDPFDIDICVTKPIVQDPVDNPYDDPYANMEDIVRDELKTSAQQYGEDKGFSALPKSNFNLEFTPSFLQSDGDHDPGIPRDTPRKPYDQIIPVFPDAGVCRNPWYVPDSSTTTITPTPSPPPGSDHLPQPNTVREMLCWLVGLNKNGYIPFIEEHLKNLLREFNKDASQLSDALEVTGDPTQLTASHISNTLTEACLYSANVLFRIKHKDTSKAISMPDFSLEYSKLCYSIDPACLLCQLRDYVYACYHQLAFLRSQCSRGESDGGWQDYKYGNGAKIPSPLQAFLTDGPDSKFQTHPFDSCNICRKSRVNMGFREEDLPEKLETGNILLTILSPVCGGEDPLLTLASYLNCLTRRTPRTTGELVSFFHLFGNELHKASSQLSKLGSALSKPHPHCPDWDILAADDLRVIRQARGSAPPIANSIHDKDHPNTLSTLLGCDIDNVNCSQLMKPITYRAYALYSMAFAHTYVSWAVYLPDRLWDSLIKLHCDLEDSQCHDSDSKSKSLHQCDKALPLLYLHSFTPPEGTLQSSLTCSKLVAKLGDVVNGQPIASLMSCMDTFLYRIRAPFLFCLVTLWLIATLYIAHSLLYRMDVLRIRSHLLTTRASHLIDVKALLAGSRRMLSLYKDVDYFDDDFHS
ncbi:ribosome binding protein [Babesia ovata]|uniref:Ribosome binding protein n=1 Tax=Babesia ovata TaxID=189622 RepID=A0A2H6KG73_9APIC|nr:ribosome binding protein [Babesia ovata]GBE62000.1 ribosome binding protein [Babesia ovata]